MKKILRRAALTLAALLGALVLVFAGYVGYLQLQYYRIEDDLALEVANAPAQRLAAGGEYTAVTCNLGFGAYGPDYSDPEGRWFESSRAHHKKTAVFSHSGLFVWILVCDTMCHKPNHIQYDFAGLPFSRFSVSRTPPQIRCLGRGSLPLYCPIRRYCEIGIRLVDL